MVVKLKRLWQLLGIHAKLDLLWLLRDTKYCLTAILADVIANLSAIAGVFLLAERFGGIGGMSKHQIMFMLGYASVIDGLIQMLFGMSNVAWISRVIGRGQLDHCLVQPVPLWMQFATSGFNPFSSNGVLLTGLGVMVYAADRLALDIGMLWIALFLVSVCCSLLVILSCSFIAGCLAFYAPVAGEEISTTAIGLFDTLKAFPIGGLSPAAQTLLCTIVPVGLAAWFPANALLGQTPPAMPSALLLSVTITLTLIAGTLFRKGMKYYAKRGSIRYHDRGHRC